MKNQAMRRKLEEGEAVDVSGFARTNTGEYVLPDFVDGVDYCDRVREVWIWSIGRHLETGVILAALDGRFYLNNEFECLWLR